MAKQHKMKAMIAANEVILFVTLQAANNDDTATGENVTWWRQTKPGMVKLLLKVLTEKAKLHCQIHR